MGIDVGGPVPAPATEVTAVVRSAAVAVAAVSGSVEGVQHAVLARVAASARLVGRIVPPVAPAAEATARAAQALGRGFSANHVVLRTTTDAIAAVVAAGARTQRSTAVAERPRAAPWVAALNGALGDHLAAHPDTRPLSTPMGVRVGGRRVAATGPDLARAFPEASPTLLVLVHGLTVTESVWGEECLSAVRRAGATPVTVRYNSGRGVAVNGAELSALLEELVAHWPRPVERIVLVGHSMGGLVVRAACAEGEAMQAGWTARLTDAVTLASPHLGSPVERVAHRVLLVLATDPVAAPIVTLGHRRSQGIKDLRFGAVLSGDWAGRPPDGPGHGGRPSRPLPPGVRHHAVVATLARDDQGLLAAVIGDGMVQPRSAGHLVGGAAHVTALRLPGVGHNALLAHPQVADLLAAVVTDHAP